MSDAMNDMLSRVTAIAGGALPKVEEAIPVIAAVAASAHGTATDHETRLQKLEDLVTQWAPLIAATAQVIDKATATTIPPKPGGSP